MDTHSWVLWVGVIAVVLHVLEEYSLGWVDWANEELGPRFGVEFTETDFMLTNVGLVFIALAGAAIGWWAPAISLAVPALFIINAVFFHMLPTARSERITPGTISAVLIYLPVSAWMFWAAGTDERLNVGSFFLAFVIGAAIMAYPIVMLSLKAKIGWQAGASARPSAGGAIQEEELPFEETPPEQVDPQVEDLPEVTDDETATAVLISDPEDGDETAIDLAEDAAPEGDDPTTELRRD